jgi:hypothetical protein
LKDLLVGPDALGKMIISLQCAGFLERPGIPCHRIPDPGAGVAVRYEVFQGLHAIDEKLMAQGIMNSVFYFADKLFSRAKSAFWSVCRPDSNPHIKREQKPLRWGRPPLPPEKVRCNQVVTSLTDIELKIVGAVRARQRNVFINLPQNHR